MVRLVFRPYTQVRRTICTSVSLRASTRVSSGFALLRHSSPSFGSQQVCSHSNPSHKLKVGRRCTPPERGSRPSASLRLAGFQTRRLAHMLDSLVRVTRRVEWKARQPTPRARRCTRPATRAHASFLGHRNGKPTGSNPPALVTMQQPVLVCTSSRAADQPEPFHIRPRRIDSLHPLPSRQFQALFNSLFKVLFIFPSRYLFAIGLSPVFSLGRNLPPN